MFKILDYYLHRITRYNLLLLNLTLFVVLSIIFSLTGLLQFEAASLAISASLLTTVCVSASFLFAKLYDATLTVGSSGITALILFCIFTPPKDGGDALNLVVVGILAIASRYVLAINRRHIFNPAAIGAVLVGWFGLVHASWWIANDVMTPFVLLLGLLTVRKLRRFTLFISFFTVATAMTLVINADTAISTTALLKDTLVSWPILFLGLFMLTEPLTTPPRQRQQIIYGSLVGLLVGLPHLHISSIFLTPELALVIGNLYAYTTTVRQQFTLRLQSKKELAPGIYELLFRSNAKPDFVAGQYADVTLAVPLTQLDVRGNRRSFTIASAPTETQLRIITRVPERASSFKQQLISLKKNDAIYVNYIGGEFTLPANQVEKIILVAGGIGVTPFISMAESLSKAGRKRDIILFYQVNGKRELLYLELWKRAGFQLIPLIKEQFSTELIKKYAPDFLERRVYVSGPPGFVAFQQAQLQKVGVQRSKIVTDYFSGY